MPMPTPTIINANANAIIPNPHPHINLTMPLPLSLTGREVQSHYRRKGWCQLRDRVRCFLWNTVLPLRMHLVPTPARLTVFHVCDQCHSSRLFTPLTGWHCTFRPTTNSLEGLPCGWPILSGCQLSYRQCSYRVTLYIMSHH
jgi:hypothetical protein